MASKTPIPDKQQVISSAGRSLAWLRKNAYLAVVAGGLLLATKAIDFEPPAKVRVEADHGVKIVGDAPLQEFSNNPGNEQAVQIRSTLRLYPESNWDVAGRDPKYDDVAQILAQPVVTTILGIDAHIEQSVQLEGGDLQVSIELVATPKQEGRLNRTTRRRELVVEREMVVKSRRKGFWTTVPGERVHLDLRSVVADIEGDDQRVVFAVDDHLFALDLEIFRARK